MENLKGREAQIVNERIRKLKELSKRGIDPYPHRFELLFEKKHSVDIKQEFKDLKNDEVSKSKRVVAGRIMTKRGFGSLIFFLVQDLKGTIQIVIKKDACPESVLEIFRLLDAGDIVGVKGKVARTKTGEISILAERIDLLSKSILPLPDKHKGLKDEEERLRKRYLDIIMNPEVKELFIKKQKFWATVRNFLIKKGFLEVETPVLENSAGGAAATPFKTHHNALGIDVYLRISMGELWQKKLLVAGYEKTFEIGRQFRNEGMDAEHLQDYTQMEFYWAYANFEDGMKIVEELYKEIAKNVLGSTKFESNGHKIDLSKKWERYDFESLIKKRTGVSIYEDSKEKIIKALKSMKAIFDESIDKWRLVDVLWKQVRKNLSGPGFLVGQPVELTPLAKRRKDDPRKVEQFQVIIGGSEMGNGYSELNDPFDQEERFKQQMKLLEKGDLEAMNYDEEFIEALKYGMPPACGFGLSERFFAFLVNRPLRECVFFPLMRPEK